MCAGVSFGSVFWKWFGHREHLHHRPDLEFMAFSRWPRASKSDGEVRNSSPVGRGVHIQEIPLPVVLSLRGDVLHAPVHGALGPLCGFVTSLAELFTILFAFLKHVDVETMNNMCAPGAMASGHTTAPQPARPCAVQFSGLRV